MKIKKITLYEVWDAYKLIIKNPIRRLIASVKYYLYLRKSRNY